MRRIPTIGMMAATAVFMMPASHAFAQANIKDFQVLARAIGFTENAPKGDVVMGVVFDPANSVSSAEADDIIKTVGGGIKAGSLKLIAEKIDVTSALKSDAKVLFLTQGSESEALFSAVSSKDVITASTHDSCLNTSQCVMVVRSTPKVDIRISFAAAVASNVTFGSAFRMMIAEQ